MLQEDILHIFEDRLKELFPLRHQIFIWEEIPAPCSFSRILNYAVNYLNLLFTQAFLSKCLLNLEYLFIILIPQGKQHANTEFLKFAYSAIMNYVV